MDLHAIKDEITKADSVVATARRLLAEGKMVDLAAVEDKVREICSAAETVTEADRPAVRAALEGLLERIDALGREIEARAGDLGASEDGPDPASAARAYAKGPGPTEGDET